MVWTLTVMFGFATLKSAAMPSQYFCDELAGPVP